ncbi:glycosyltransferase family 2 protein [Bradyrhizobium arachidis]|uniref:glycosyltransferase family 2 protein n=1 Tax=Bradyrhizobium arachidis TaxID=858423 RepID=UPI0021616BC7|nr:glycosyltransferase family 2 protein [Bradyrhizobium arachidis]UVO27611.1 glycosyltransferase family 2 protein [Bradyrhizobium arachidis]
MNTLHPELVRQDRRNIPDNKSEIRVFAVLRDEMLRLPYFLNYYRQLGVSRFFIIDNGSKDGSGQFVLDQPDCHVFYTEGSYGKSRAGVYWLNSLLDTYGVSHWIILADTDELFVYPGCENTELQQFCNWLDQSGHEAVYALLLDMYSSLPIREVNYRQGEDFRATCSYHDSSYVVVRRYGFPSAFPPFEHIGGPRLRLCFGDQNTPALWPRLKPKLARRALSVAHKAGFLHKQIAPVVATQAYKVPLVKWRKGNGYVNSHRLNAVRLSPVTGALLHFKYFQDFGKRIEDSLAHGEHYGGSIEYRRYGELLAANPNLSLIDAESVRYSSSRELVDRGLMRTDSGWMSIV